MEDRLDKEWELRCGLVRAKIKRESQLEGLDLLRELMLAGDAGKKDLYEDARQVMQKEAEKDFRRLPIFAYSGSAGPGDVVQLTGFTVKQGAAQ